MKKQYSAFKKPLTEVELIELLDLTGEDYSLSLGDGITLISFVDVDSTMHGGVTFYSGKDEIDFDFSTTYLVKNSMKGACGNLIFTDDPKCLFLKLLKVSLEKNLYLAIDKLLDLHGESKPAFIHPSAVIEDNVFIGQGTVVSAGCVVKSGTSIGRNCIIRENTVVGVDGISPYRTSQGELIRFPHVAGVIIGDNVEIGASCVIAKGTLWYTEIADNTIIGNLCNVGHSCIIGMNVWLSVGSLIGGYVTVEDNSTIAMDVSIKNATLIKTNSSIGMGSVVTKPTKENCSYFGNPAIPVRGLKAGPDRL